MDVPMDVQIPLFSKILTYDRTLSSRTGGHIVLCILYQGSFKGSYSAKDNFLKTISTSQLIILGGVPFNIALIDLDVTTDINHTFHSLNANVAYITPLRAYDIDMILEPARDNKIITLTGVSAYADLGVSVAIGTQNQRPQILINLPSARAEGAEFNSNFLKLVRVLQ
jgi:hypothetical protein